MVDDATWNCGPVSVKREFEGVLGTTNPPDTRRSIWQNRRKNDFFKKFEELRVVGGNCAVSVEHGQGDARHLFKRLAIGFEARGGPHALNRHHEEVSQCFGVMRARDFSPRGEGG
jgi:hypothetical protein